MEPTIIKSPRVGVKFHGHAGSWAAQILLGVLASCSAPTPPASPEEALLQANAVINRKLETSPQTRISPSAPMPTPGADELTFWYYDHPLIGPAVDQNGPPRTRSLYIGGWDVAIQKLLVAFVAGDVPDVALVKRELVAGLYHAGRIRALDTILPEALLKDFREEVFEDYTVDNHLIALPADGFCSVLFYNRRLIGDTPPKTWVFYNAHLNARRDLGAIKPDSFGAFPFIEALWSTGGDVVMNGRASLDSAEASRAIRYVLDATGGKPRGEAASFHDFMHGKSLMTVASSQRRAEADTAAFPVGFAPVPGETGPISRRSNDAVVVFVREGGAGASALSAFLNWLTGELVYTSRSQAAGNVPIRRSVEMTGVVPEEIVEAYRAGRNTPLISDWGAIEMEVERGVNEAYRCEILD